MERENSFGIKTGALIEQLNVYNADCVKDEYMPGYPLLIENGFGKGTATYIATQLFSKYFGAPSTKVRNNILSILNRVGVEPPYARIIAEDNKDNPDLVTSAMYDNDGNLNIITVSNTYYYEAEETLILPFGNYELVEKNDNITFENENFGTCVNFKLKALESFAVFKCK